MNVREDGLEETTSNFWDSLPQPLSGFAALGLGLLLTALTTIACLGVVPWLPAHGVAMLFLLAVVGGAVAFGMLCGLSAAVSAFFAYNYFFLQPVSSFAISDPGDVISLAVFLGVAAASGSLAGRLREVADRARARSSSLQRLNAVAARLSSASTFSDVVEGLTQEASTACSGSAAVMRCAADGAVEPQAPADLSLSTADWQAAQRSLVTRQAVYPASPGWQGSAFAFYPIVVREKGEAILCIPAEAVADNASDAMFCAMARNAAVALERISLEAEKSTVRKEAEAERLRAALLSSVSHDIKTPLASIQGAVTSLRELGSQMPEEARADLLIAIQEESERLLRFVTNLLDMTRLQAGASGVLEDWVDLGDIVSASVVRARQLMPRARIDLDTSSVSAIIRGNETLLEHVIVNVVENSVNASDGDAEIDVKISENPEVYRVTIEDGGSGIAPEDLPQIFDKFFRGPETARRGSGLGLTIGREVMRAMGGTISAESPIAGGRGTRITLTFPKPDQASENAGGQI